MSYKPTNEELMAYLYGELDESHRAQIEQYLKDNPEARAEFKTLKNLHSKAKQAHQTNTKRVKRHINEHI